jgi:predicted phosphodiesterase
MIRTAAILYDVHGNLPALEAVLQVVDAEDTEVIVCGGDLLLGPCQAECFAILRDRNARFLKGNQERMVLAGDGGLQEWCQGLLSDEIRQAAAGWPAGLELDFDNIGRVAFFHASPRRDDEILTIATPSTDLRSALGVAAAGVIVVGHTHQQFDRTVDGVRIVNAGSVGLPYEGEAGAYWVRIDSSIEFRRTAYDTDLAIERMRSSGMPELDEFFAECLIHPIPRQEATAQFEAQAGR